MIVDPTNVANGIQLGTSRARRRFMNFNLDLDGLSRDRIETVLGWWPLDLHGAFVELFVELATTASITRAHNQEAPLTEDEVSAYLAHSASFLNSFKHR